MLSFEQKLGHNILYLTCRHHLYEIVLQGVFSEVKLATSTGSDILLFKKFRKQWTIILLLITYYILIKILHITFMTGIIDKSVNDILKDNNDDIIMFAKNKRVYIFRRHSTTRNTF